MANRKPLRAVAPDEKAPVAPPKTLMEAVESGTYAEILIAQRREMVRDVSGMTGPAKAAMHRQIALLSKEIEGLLRVADDEEDADASGDIDDTFDASAV